LARIIVGANIKAEGAVKGNIGVAEGTVRGDVYATIPNTPIDVTVPRRLRNWFVDNVLLSRHQKLLLRMSINQRSFDGVKRGLRTIWQVAN
jgi:hypothetical protein